MACTSTVTQPVNVNATPEVVAAALVQLGVKGVAVLTRKSVRGIGVLVVQTPDGLVLQDFNGSIDMTKFRQEIAVQKAMETARKQKYRTVRRVQEGEKVVVYATD